MRLQRTLDEHLQTYIDALYRVSGELAHNRQGVVGSLLTTVREQPRVVEFDGGAIVYDYNANSVENIVVDPPNYPIVVPIDIYLESKDKPSDILSSLDYITELVSDWAIDTDLSVGKLHRVVDDLRSEINEILANPMLSDMEGALKAGSKAQFEALIGMDAEEEPLIEEIFDREYWVRRSLSYLVVITEPRSMEPPRLLTDVDDSYRMRGRYRHQDAYVIGFDDTPDEWFIYPVDGSRVSKAMDLADAGVRRAMGYQFDADESTVRTAVERAASQLPSAPRPFEDQAKNAATTSRVQGDLFVEVLDQYDSAAEAHAATDGCEALLTVLAEETSLDAVTLSDILRTTTLYIDDDDSTAQVQAAVTQQAYEFVEQATLDVSYTPPELGGSQLEQRINGLATGAETYSLTLETLFGDPPVLSTRSIAEQLRTEIQSVWDTVDNAGRTARFTRPSERTGKLTLPIDNHLLLFQNAWVSPLSYREQEPVSVIVPEDCLVTIPHDEHTEKTFNLPAGAYRFYLGVPGVKPFPSDRPEWIPTDAAPNLDSYTPDRRF